MKAIRIITSALVLVLLSVLLAAGTLAAKPDVSTMPSEDDIITTVGIIGIMNGDQNGNLNLDSYVTRAEFTKIALCTSVLKDSVNTASKVSPFYDVKSGHWASGYIITAVSNGYLRGYVDGSFKPDNRVTLEEAVTVMLRILGYSELDSGKYPDSQLAKYTELKMDNLINAQRGDALTRRQCMYLAYNTLCAETRSGTQHCQTLGYTADSNGRIDYMKLVDDKTDGPFTVLSDGTVNLPFPAEKAEILLDGRRIALSDVKLYDIYYYSEPIKKVWVYRDSETGIVDSVNIGGTVTKSANYSGAPASNNGIIVSGASYSLGNDDVKYKFSAHGSIKTEDFILLLMGRDGTVADAHILTDNITDYLDDDDDRVALINSTLKGPYILKQGEILAEKLPFGTEKAEIYYGTKLVSADFAKTNDVYYYSEPFKSVWLYRDTATGFVNAISPSRENPTSITVGSKNYTLEGATVKQQFSNFGTFDKDDFVTILLGNGGTAVYAIEADVYAYLADNDDGVSFADIAEQSMEGPTVVKSGTDWQSKIPFDITKADFYRKNSKVSYDTVKEYDVLYYSKALTSVWIYTDKITGIFENTAPNRISPTSVTVSGKTYQIESTGAAFALSNMGTYKLGDAVTLIFGRNGGVVEVIPGNESTETLYGFITSFGEGTYTRPNGTTYTAENITVMGTDTVSYTYEHGENGLTKGDFVSVTFADGKAKISKISSGVNAAKASEINSLIAADAIADGAVLLDVYITTDSDSLENKTVSYCSLYPSRLSGVKLSANDIYYAKTENGQITELVLRDFTGDIHTYGVITTERSAGGSDYYMINAGNKKRITVNTAYGTPLIGAAKFTERGGKYTVKNLSSVTVEKQNFGRATSSAGGKTFAYASNVEFYIKTGAREFEVSTYEDIAEGGYKITAYYDNTPENGGRVRIIIAE